MRLAASTLLLTAALTAALAAPLARPALAEPAYEMRATYEMQSFGWYGPAANSGLTFTAPMTTYTVVDHTGGVFGAFQAVAKTETNRMAAEREARRKGESSYQYVQEQYRAHEGTQFGFTVGQGGFASPQSSGTSAPTVLAGSGYSRMARISLDGDVADIGPGALVFESSVAYWSATLTDTRASRDTTIEAWNWPLGLRYRWAPGFLPGFVVEPWGNFDWLVSLEGAVNGRPTFAARNFGVDVGYHVLPQLKVRAGYALNRLAHNQVGWMTNQEIVDMRNLTAGATLYF